MSRQLTILLAVTLGGTTTVQASELIKARQKRAATYNAAFARARNGAHTDPALKAWVDEFLSFSAQIAKRQKAAGLAGGLTRSQKAAILRELRKDSDFKQLFDKRGQLQKKINQRFLEGDPEYKSAVENYKRLLELQIEGDPEYAHLPRVLLIGDSISMGYTPYVIEMLEGKASVRHHRGNAGPTIRGVEKIEDWLGSTEWDVIHFNWGLHDMYGWVYAKEDRSPAMYEQRLEALVARLKKTGARLIWATTTPACPAAEHTMLNNYDTRVVISPEQEKQYQDTALRVMKKHRIRVNNLHALMKLRVRAYALAEDDVHYTEDGYEFLAREVVDSVSDALK